MDTVHFRFSSATSGPQDPYTTVGEVKYWLATLPLISTSSWSTCSAVLSSSPHGKIGDGTIFSFLDILVFGLLCQECSLDLHDYLIISVKKVVSDLNLLSWVHQCTQQRFVPI